MSTWEILAGDCRVRLAEMDENSVDAVVTDPPYELNFMGKKWDRTGIAYDAAMWRLVLRVLKPGGHLLAFGGTRTYHRMTCAIEDAGFEIRDSIHWIYGSGFPKGLRVDNELYLKVLRCLSSANAKHVVQVSKPIRLRSPETQVAFVVAAARILPEGDPCLLIQTGGAGVSLGLMAMSVSQSEAESIALNTTLSWSDRSAEDLNDLKTSTIETVSDRIIGSRIWSYLQSQSTPACTIRGMTLPNGSQWCACTVAEDLNGESRRSAPIPVVSALGGVINPLSKYEGYNLALKPGHEPIVLARKPLLKTVAINVLEFGTGGLNIDGCRIESIDPLVRPEIKRENNTVLGAGLGAGTQTEPSGRWPANVIIDEDAARELDAQSGIRTTGAWNGKRNGDKHSGIYNPFAGADGSRRESSSGGASRFFYVAKSSRAERERGLEHLPMVRRTDGRKTEHQVPNLRTSARRNHHPTVKPIALMRHLVRLITPPNGLVLDPFAGSGTTGIAALQEGFRFIGIDLDPESQELARNRIAEDAPLFNRKNGG